MISYNTAVDFPKYAIADPPILDEEDLDWDPTECGTAQDQGNPARLTMYRGEDWDIVDTALECPTRFVTVSTIVSDPSWDAEAAWNKILQQETHATKAFSEVVIGETTDLAFEWMIASQSRVSPTFRLIAQLKSLFETPEDERWPSTTWPIQDAFEDARAFISKLPLTRIPEPEIRVADDGEINFLWIRENVHIDLGFYGTGTYSYFGYDRKGQEIQAENVLAVGGLADPIKTMLAV